MEATSITWLEASLAQSVQVSCIKYFTYGALFPNPDSFTSFIYNQTVGWTWQGGLAGSTGGRLYGMCVYVLPRRVRVPVGANNEH